MQECFTKEQISQEINQTISSLFDISRVTERRLQHTKDVLIELSEKFQLLKDGKFEEARGNYISTGYSALDSLTGGGINTEEDFIILAARPSMGKSGLLKDIVLNLTEKTTKPILYISLEMSNKSVVNRMIVSTSEIDNYKLSSGFRVDWEKVDNAIEKLSKRDIYFVDLGALKVSEILAYKNQIESETGKKLGAVVIDYLQLMDSESSDNRVQEISKISRGLKKFVQDYKIPVIALSQLSRTVEQRQDKRPMLSDLRESGSLEQDASQVWFIYRPGYYDPNTDKKRIAELIVAKSRNSAVGTIDLYYESTLIKFTGLEK
jgi:replicative DNA helicase